MNKTNTEKWRNKLLLFTAWCVLSASLAATPVTAQLPAAQLPAELKPTEAVEDSWQAPDLAELPTDWWLQLENKPAELSSQRVELLLDAMQQRTLGLGGDELVTAQSGIAYIRSQFELLAVARQGPLELKFAPPMAKETYFLEDLLNLRSQWRELQTRATRVELEIEQSERKSGLLQNRREKSLRDYASADPESPSRILLGINRVATRVEIELASANTVILQKTLKQIEAQSQLLVDQQEFARQHLVITDTSLSDLRAAKVEAGVRVTETKNKVSALQPQLLEALTAELVNPSLEVLRQQQLTRAAAEAQLAKLQELLAASKLNWYLFRKDEMDSGFDLQPDREESRQIIEEALKQAELWSTTSQSTLITRSSDTSLNTVKNIEIAQSVARDTLVVIDQIRSVSDDLSIIEELLTSEYISTQSGIRHTGARLSLVLENTWKHFSELADFHLFYIGETPVTTAGIVKMLLILGLAIAISWVIRHLIARGLRRKRATESPAFYTLGRILHYIIVVAGSFAALGSIGIDFTSFALIAGALSVGIGFGLQAIVSNFVSGLILLFEGTMRVGDFIEMDGGLCGVVKEINTRATVIRTNDSVDVVVPNTDLVTTPLTNWTLRESYGRMRVNFGVAYGSDKDLVKKVAFEALEELDCALTHMPGLEPHIRLSNFGDNSLDFTFLFWVSRQGVRRPGRTRASFLWSLETLMRENGIEIPFPQRDIHIRSDFRNPEDRNSENRNPEDLKPALDITPD